MVVGRQVDEKNPLEGKTFVGLIEYKPLKPGEERCPLGHG